MNSQEEIYAAVRARRRPTWPRWRAPAAAGWLLAWAATAQTFSALYTFSGVYGEADGGNPSSLMLASNGLFYGTCVNLGLNGWGGVYQMSPAGALKPVYSFTNQNPVPDDGANPYAGLAQGTNGFLYGLAQTGGSNGSGTIFKVSTNGSFTSFYSFTELKGKAGSVPAVATNADGAMPKYALALDTNNGNFYGTAGQGGTNSYGTVFQVTHAGKVTVLYSFSNSVDGSSPQASLLPYTNGDLYGTAFSGGSNGYGTVFQVTTAGRLTPLYSFTNGLDGANPQGALIDGRDGLLYGTCAAGGTNGTGAIFAITTKGVLTALYSFSAATGSGTSAYNDDGINPNVLVLGSDGNFYGTAQFGSLNGNGSIFQFTRAGALNVLYAFNYDSEGGPNSDGANPVSLLQDANGNFYGTALHGGANSFGTFFTLGLAPVITAQPADQSIALHGNANFSLTAGGAQGYQWQWDGADLPNATNDTLTITNAQIAAAGSYQAIVTNINGATASSVVTLSITNVPAAFVTTAGALEYGGGRFTMQLTDLTGQGAVVIEASTNLLQWTPIATNASGFGAAPFTDPAAGSFPIRFYRATTP